MTISWNAAAKFVCERSSWQVTNLALQKILYISQMFYLGKDNARLVNASFEAWDYGPVIPSLYHQVKAFGNKPIRNVFESGHDISKTAEGAFLSDACDYLLTKNPGELVAITHWDEGAWAQHYQPGVKGIVIPDADIVREYRARTASPKAA